MKLIIIKLGGSAITNKKRPFKARVDIIKRSGSQIKRIIEKGWRVILVHGGGSFGHYTAKKYGLGDAKRIMSVRLSMLRLDEIVVSTLLSEDLNVYPIHTSCIGLNEDKLIIDLKVIRAALDLNFIPILQGDVILDYKLGVRIISGDEIIKYLADKLRPRKVIFGSDVKGVYNKNPLLYKDAVLIKSLSPSLTSIDMRDNGYFDVTGGIKKKLKIMFEIASMGIPVYMCSLIKDEYIIKIVNNIRGDYTRIII